MHGEPMKPIHSLKKFAAEDEGSVLSGIISLFLSSLLLLACSSTRYVTQTKRSGVEQLLLAKAMDGALQQEPTELRGSKIFVETISLIPELNPYIEKALRHWFLKNGALLTKDRKEADTVASVLVKCAGTDGTESKFGIPPIPIPLTEISTPSITFFSYTSQRGCAEMEILLYTDAKGFVEKLPPLSGKSYFEKYMILFISISRQNIY
jgi:hypothetical protein